jgi:hypothetical protein
VPVIAIARQKSGNKSFLLLFFKKEVLAFACLPLLDGTHFIFLNRNRNTIVAAQKPLLC